MGNTETYRKFYEAKMLQTEKYVMELKNHIKTLQAEMDKDYKTMPRDYMVKYRAMLQSLITLADTQMRSLIADSEVMRQRLRL